MRFGHGTIKPLPASLNLKTERMLRYLWLEVRMEQHVSIGVDGKIISVRADLKQTKHSDEDASGRKTTTKPKRAWFMRDLAANPSLAWYRLISPENGGPSCQSPPST